MLWLSRDWLDAPVLGQFGLPTKKTRWLFTNDSNYTMLLLYSSKNFDCFLLYESIDYKSKETIVYSNNQYRVNIEMK